MLIVYETGDVLPESRNGILYGKAMRDYLRANCPVGPDGRTGFRIFDKDVDASGDAEVWRDAMARPRKSVPWLVVSDGGSGYEGPLPATVDDTLKILKQHGGK